MKRLMRQKPLISRLFVWLWGSGSDRVAGFSLGFMCWLDGSFGLEVIEMSSLRRLIEGWNWRVDKTGSFAEIFVDFSLQKADTVDIFSEFGLVNDLLKSEFLRVFIFIIWNHFIYKEWIVDVNHSHPCFIFLLFVCLIDCEYLINFPKTFSSFIKAKKTCCHVNGGSVKQTLSNQLKKLK